MNLRRTLPNGLLVVTALLTPSLAARAVPTDDDRAKDLVKQGTALYSNGDTRGAEAKFNDAWGLKKTADIAGNLGAVELELKEYDRATTHLAFCAKNLPLSTSKAQHDAIEKQLAEAKKHVGTVTLDVAPTGVEIDVDGENAGLSPLEGPVFVNPGDHTIVAKREGLVTKTVTLSLTAGQEHAEKIALVPMPALPSEPPKPPPQRDTATQAEHRSPVPGGVLLGVGGAVTITGAVLLGLMAQKESEARNLGRGLICAPTRMDAGCTQLESVVNTRNDFVVSGGISTGVGLALAVAGVAYLAWPNPRTQSSVSVVPLISTQAGGVVIGGSF